MSPDRVQEFWFCNVKIDYSFEETNMKGEGRQKICREQMPGFALLCHFRCFLPIKPQHLPIV
jgi:hypothetical protein